MAWLWLTAALLALAFCLLGLAALRARRQRETAQVHRMRATNLYAHLYPVLTELSAFTVEQVAVTEEEVCARLLRPTREVHFHYKEQGFDPPDEKARLALAQAIGSDLPGLMDPERYVFTGHRHRLRNGERSTWYDYLLTNEEKERLLNEPGRRDRVPGL